MVSCGKRGSLARPAVWMTAAATQPIVPAKAIAATKGKLCVIDSLRVSRSAHRRGLLMQFAPQRPLAPDPRLSERLVQSWAFLDGHPPGERIRPPHAVPTQCAIAWR